MVPRGPNGSPEQRQTYSLETSGCHQAALVVGQDWRETLDENPVAHWTPSNEETECLEILYSNAKKKLMVDAVSTSNCWFGNCKAWRHPNKNNKRKHEPIVCMKPRCHASCKPVAKIVLCAYECITALCPVTTVHVLKGMSYLPYMAILIGKLMSEIGVSCQTSEQLV